MAGSDLTSHDEQAGVDKDSASSHDVALDSDASQNKGD